MSTSLCREVCAPPMRPRRVGPNVHGTGDPLSEATAARDVGEFDAARQALRELALHDDRLRRWLAAARLLHEVRGPASDALRVTLLGTSTLDQTAQAIELAGLLANLDLRVATPSYGQYEAAALDPAGVGFDPLPDIVVLLPDLRARSLPAWEPDPDRAVEEWVRSATSLWETIHSRAQRARILQANLVAPPGSPVGTLQRIDPHGRDRIVRQVNDRLAEEAGGQVAIVDVAGLATQLGTSHWYDDRYWFHAKQAVSLNAVPLLAREVVKVLAAAMGRSRKVVVTDLDDTLWGGIVGEDGVAGLRLGGDPVGEAHLALQHYLRELKDRGVVLAVCSKNDADQARRPFLERTDMVLQLEDISAFVANWEPKSQNLRRIAHDLDLGLDALVFLDDNPAEREQVRVGCPEVDVIELPADSAGYVDVLDRYPLLDTVAVTAEDAERTAQYRARAQAKALERDAGTVEDFLAGLEMRAEIREFDDVTLPRVVQLIGKTNQWNLTTRRHDAAAVQRMVEDPHIVTRSARLEDRFGDHGLVAVAIARIEGDAAVLDTLLMSCRVIGRRLEHTLLAEIAAATADKGATTLAGEFIPTERNGLVAKLFPTLGFTQHSEDGAVTRWRLGVDAARLLATPYIDVVSATGSDADRAEDVHS